MKTKLISLLCAALLLTLCSCAQSQVNSDRLINGTDGVETGTASAGDLTDSEGDGTEDAYLNTSSEIELGPVGPAPTHTETDGNVFEMNFFGYGQVRYYINDVHLADSMDAAGIDEAIYQLSGNRSYDYYLAISMSVENVDVPVGDEDNAEAISNHSRMNDFQLQGVENGSEVALILEPKYFDRGSMASTDAKRYFEYNLPDIGETLDVVIAFGFPSEALDTIQADSVALYLCNTVTGDMIEIKDLL